MPTNGSSTMPPCADFRLLLSALLLLAATPAVAEEEPLLEDPPGLIGASPTPMGGIALTLTGAYARARSGPNRQTLGGGLEIEAGIGHGLDLRLSQEIARGDATPYPADPAQRRTGGATQAGLRWQLATETDALPAFGLFAALRTEYGQRSRPAQSVEATALLGRTLREGEQPVAAVLNIGWNQIVDPDPGERGGRYQVAAGLAHALARDTSVGISYARAQQDRGERDLNMVAAGLWHRTGAGGALLGVSAAAGLGRDSPRMELGLALKWVFGGDD